MMDRPFDPHRGCGFQPQLSRQCTATGLHSHTKVVLLNQAVFRVGPAKCRENWWNHRAIQSIFAELTRSSGD